MNASESAQKVVKEFGTNDIFVIAEKSNVKIVYANWHPVTVGEYDKKTRTICVNRRVVESGKFSECEIVAHELGHFFAAEFNLDRKTEESFAAKFAEEFTKNTDQGKNKI